MTEKKTHVWDDEGYTNYRRRIVRESQRRRRMKAESEGRCIVCCINDADIGKKTCSECRKKISGAQKKR